MYTVLLLTAFLVLVGLLVLVAVWMTSTRLRQFAQARQDTRDREHAAQAAALRDQVTQAQEQIRALELVRDRLAEDYRDAQRLEAVGRLVGGVAHDFNNQLTSIIGYTELLLWDLKEEDPKRPDLLEVRRAADRANIVTQQLLAFTRSQPRQQVSVSLADSVLGSVRLLRRVLGPDVQFTTEFERDQTVVHLDPALLGHALLNLGVRARERMPQGGTIGFTVAHVTLGDREITAWQLPEPGRYAALTVRATATVAAPTAAPTAAPADLGPGTRALGVVRQIMGLSGGALVIHPDQNGDASEAFTLYFPRMTEQDDVVVPAAPRGTETILVVDDEPVVRDLTRTLLERHGYHVLTADRPSEALTRARNLRGSFDLLITDLLLPEQRGDALAASLAAAGSSARVLYMSGNDASSEIEGRLDPWGAFLLKPFTPDQLLIAVRQAIDAPPPVPPNTSL